MTRRIQILGNERHAWRLLCQLQAAGARITGAHIAPAVPGGPAVLHALATWGES